MKRTTKISQSELDSLILQKEKGAYCHERASERVNEANVAINLAED